MTTNIIRPIKNDHVAEAMKHAKEAHLVYVNDSEEGFSRRKRGKSFVYLFRGETLKDKNQLKRIRGLVIPPAWQEVWICVSESGHLQATGKDLRKRKQYRYHPKWSKLRNETKFHRMLEFGKLLPKLRAQVEKDLKLPDLPQQKVLATVVHLMEQTHIRIGNQVYEKENGSHGLTTLKDKHVTIANDALRFSFKGKKGVAHSISLRSKRLAKIVRQCRDIPGNELFQYINPDGSHHVIDSGKVNEYIRDVMGGDFSAKDFRTWAGTLHAFCALKKIERGDSLTLIKQNIVQVLDEVSIKLGNTRTVCKKYYVNPLLFDLFEEDKLAAILSTINVRSKTVTYGLTTDEEVLMRILKKAA